MIFHMHRTREMKVHTAAGTMDGKLYEYTCNPVQHKEPLINQKEYDIYIDLAYIGSNYTYVYAHDLALSMIAAYGQGTVIAFNNISDINSDSKCTIFFTNTCFNGKSENNLENIFLTLWNNGYQDLLNKVIPISAVAMVSMRWKNPQVDFYGEELRSYIVKMAKKKNDEAKTSKAAKKCFVAKPISTNLGTMMKFKVAYERDEDDSSNSGVVTVHKGQMDELDAAISAFSLYGGTGYVIVLNEYHNKDKLVAYHVDSLFPENAIQIIVRSEFYRNNYNSLGLKFYYADRNTNDGSMRIVDNTEEFLNTIPFAIRIATERGEISENP